MGVVALLRRKDIVVSASEIWLFTSKCRLHDILQSSHVSKIFRAPQIFRWLCQSYKGVCNWSLDSQRGEYGSRKRGRVIPAATSEMRGLEAPFEARPKSLRVHNCRRVMLTLLLYISCQSYLFSHGLRSPDPVRQACHACHALGSVHPSRALT